LLGRSRSLERIVMNAASWEAFGLDHTDAFAGQKACPQGARRGRYRARPKRRPIEKCCTKQNDILYLFVALRALRAALDPMEEIIKGVWPFMIAQLLVLALLIFLPALVTVPARWFGP